MRNRTLSQAGQLEEAQAVRPPPTVALAFNFIPWAAWGSAHTGSSLCEVAPPAEVNRVRGAGWPSRRGLPCSIVVLTAVRSKSKGRSSRVEVFGALAGGLVGDLNHIYKQTRANGQTYTYSSPVQQRNRIRSEFMAGVVWLTFAVAMANFSSCTGRWKMERW